MDNMDKTVVALYDNVDDAQRAIQDLADNGFSRDDISITASDAEGRYATYLDHPADDDVSGAEGAGFGAVVGGLTGLLVGLGALAIPGIGPVLVAGPIAATLIGAGVGAVTGGLVGALVDMGVPEDEAGYYVEGVRRGGTLVTVKTSGMMSDQAIEILDRHNPVDLDDRVSTWQSTGWTVSSPNRDAYTTTGTSTDWSSSTTTSGSTYTAPDINREGTLDRDMDTLSDDEYYRRHYTSTYATSGYGYDWYAPAYQYGTSLRSEDRYRGRDWYAIEPEVRSSWERQHPQNAWEDVKDAIHYAWERTTETLGIDDDDYDSGRGGMRRDRGTYSSM